MVAGIGEVWRYKAQINREAQYGSPVAARRVVYLEEPSFTRERVVRPHRFATGGRENQRSVTLGPVTAAGSVRIPISPDELLEWLELLFGASATPSTPSGAVNARRHVFIPGDTSPPSATIEYHDGAAIRRVIGVMCNQLTIAGSVAEANNASFDLFAADYVEWAGPLTTLADRTPAFLEGWQTNAYLDAHSGVPGTTKLSDSVLNWQVQINNNLGRKYWAQNSLATGGIVSGMLDVTAQLTLEAANAVAAAELANWDAGTLRMLRLEFIGAANGIELNFAPLVWVDLPLAWTAADLTGEDAGTRVYQMSGSYVYSPSLGAGIKITCQTSRTTTFEA